MAPKAEERPPDVLCQRCERMCEPQEVQTCPACERVFCHFCEYRVGSRSYCSRACGDSFFFGDLEDEPVDD